MIIGIDCRVLTTGICGISRYTANLIIALSDIDRNNQYILFSDKNFELNLGIGQNFKTVILPSKSNLAWEQYILPRALRRYGADIFHCPQNRGIPYLKQCKFVLTIHDLIPRIFPDYWEGRGMVAHFMYKISLSISVSGADRIIVDSKSTKRDVINIFGIPDDKVVVVYPALDISLQRNAVAMNQLNFPPEIAGKFLLHFSGIGFNKNTMRVLDAYRILKSRNRLGYQLVIVGSLFDRRLLEKANELEGVIVLEKVNDGQLSQLYKNASLLLYPSLYEGFGLPVLEAMHFGVPVVVSNNSSLPEVAGEAGLYARADDVRDIAEKIETIISDANINNELIRKGHRQAEQFSWLSAANQTLGIYKELYS